jgi:hypothetical protein
MKKRKSMKKEKMKRIKEIRIARINYRKKIIRILKGIPKRLKRSRN